MIRKRFRQQPRLRHAARLRMFSAARDRARQCPKTTDTVRMLHACIIKHYKYNVMHRCRTLNLVGIYALYVRILALYMRIDVYEPARLRAAPIDPDMI